MTEKEVLTYEQELDMAVASYVSAMNDHRDAYKIGKITDKQLDIKTRSVNRRFVKIMRDIQRNHGIQRTVEFLKNEIDNMEIDPAKL